MTPINFHKKEKPLTSLVSMGGGAAGMANAGLAAKTYIEDVFKTDLWNGVSDAAQLVGTGIDYTKGGMVWNKKRDSAASNNVVIDTENGPNKALFTNNSQNLNTITSGSEFTNNGFNWASENNFHGSNTTQVSWNFRKQKGFFDVVTWDGDGETSQQLSHGLGCVPGMIVVKCTTNSGSEWMVYHRDTDPTDPANYRLLLDQTVARVADTGAFNNTEPTATHFTVGDGSNVNALSRSYVAYLFAGGESPEDTARSVKFNTSALTIGSSNDFSLPGDFTIEYWFKPDGTGNAGPMALGAYNVNGGFEMFVSGGAIKWYTKENNNANYRIEGERIIANAWNHIALVRSGTTVKLYLNGVPSTNTYTSSIEYGPTGNNHLTIGASNAGSPTSYMDGEVSNFRIVKGTAVYTSVFKPSTEPLTNISGTVLLCCNNSSTTGSTVSPSTITTSNTPSASTQSPFDDPAGFKFGEDGDQNIVKTGGYQGGGSYMPEIYVGFQPQWILIKNINLTTEQWFVFDTMRGIVSNGIDYVLEASRNVEENGWDLIDLTPTGFKIKINDDKVNNNGGNYIYMAFRRPDGYVGKPPEVGTDAFNVVLGAGNATIPEFAANFAVDTGIVRQFANVQNFYVASRLTGTNYLQTNNTASEASAATFVFDSNAGWNSNSNNTNISWMWKRGAGFDMLCYTGDGSGGGREIRHSLNKVPEMMWLFNAGGGDSAVYHKGLGGGSSPETKSLKLNETDTESITRWQNTLPTNIAFTISSSINSNGDNWRVMLFASVDGISKCGYYSGDGSANLTITTGFLPRFILVKKSNGAGAWHLFDSVRGMGSGYDKLLQLNSDAAQLDVDYVTPTATGWTTEGTSLTNGQYIYYAHA